MQNEIIISKIGFASKRNDGYIKRRKELEKIAFEIFKNKGGKPKSIYPYYLVVEECIWLESWYEKPNYIKNCINDFNIEELSFSYGDLFPTFSENIIDNKEYRKKVYTFDEIKEIIKKYGLPQEWNSEGKYGPERYIEVQFWNENINEIIDKGIYKHKI